eukprot:6180534-Pleurochrysis_carterae.AAC.2
MNASTSSGELPKCAATAIYSYCELILQRGKSVYEFSAGKYRFASTQSVALSSLAETGDPPAQGGPHRIPYLARSRRTFSEQRTPRQAASPSA